MSSQMFWMDTHLSALFNDPAMIPLNTRSIMEIGAGLGIVGRIARLLRPIRQLDAVEVWMPYAHILGASGDYDTIFIDRVQDLDLSDHPGLPYDLVLCFEVLEHMDHADALNLLDGMREVGRKVIVSTPSYFLKQGAIDANPYQIHRCAITPEDFRAYGYETRGVGNMRYLPVQSRIVQKMIPFAHKTVLGIWTENGGERE